MTEWQLEKTAPLDEFVRVKLASGVETKGILAVESNFENYDWLVDITEQPETQEGHDQWRADVTHWKPIGMKE